MFNIIKSMFRRENSVKSASIILIVTLALSNVLGVFRDHFLAQKIPTDRLDVYFAAFRLPDLIFNVLILGSVAAAFVPVYSGYLKDKGKEEAIKLVQTTITIGLTAVAACLLILVIFMPYLMNLLVPSFDVAKKAETVHLARWLLLSPLFFTVSYFIGGLLNSHKRFLAYSLAPLVYNFSIISGVLIFSGRYGVGGAVIGVIIGAFLHMAVQLPSAYHLGFRPKWIFNYSHEGVKRIIKLMVPRTIALGTNQILLVGYTVLASAFSGGIAVYTFADNIQTVPSVIFGTSFATAVFPTLAGLTITKIEEKEKFEMFFLKSLRAILYFLIPSTVAILILRAQIVRLILGYGFFGWSDTKIAAATLGFFALSIVAQGVVPLLARSFYALSNTRTPMITSIISLVVSIIFGYIFSRSNYGSLGGVAGLAAAFSLGSWLNVILMGHLLNKKITIPIGDLALFLVKVCLLTVVMAFVLQWGKEAISDVLDIDRVRYLLVQTVVSATAAAVFYLLGSWALKIREIRS